ncbi:MAG TPA: HAMP domain-containing protein, partial [Acidimicrobiales bacterium]|nr:HAMP domain-containing protein [Acidimicrobiales bacterium]
MTLRARLVVALAAAGVAVLVTAGVVVTSQRQYLLDQLDRQLVSSSPPAVRLAETPATAGTSGAPFASPTNLPSALFETYLALVSADGEELRVLFPGPEGRGSPSLAGLDLARLAAEGTPVTVDAVGGGGSYRVRVVDGRAGLAAIALPLDRLEASVARLLLLSAIGAGVILGLLGLLGWWVVRLGLRPIRAMTAAADAIAAGDLSQRVDQLPAATEAGRLARAFN